MLTFIKFELKYWLRSPMLWIFLGVISLISFGIGGSENIVIGSGTGNTHKNAPQVIQNYYGIFTILTILMTTSFMNATAVRDFQSGMYQFVFSSPIKKRDYFFGKFLGAVIVSVIPLLGVSIGSIIAPWMPWVQPERYGPIDLSGHISGLLTLGIPNVIITGVFLYSLAMLFRNNIVSFVGAMLLLTAYSVSSGFLKDLEKEWLANILDPFGVRPLSIISKYMTVDQKNTSVVPFTGGLLYNRIIWLFISFSGLFILYKKFSFTSLKTKGSKKNILKEIYTGQSKTYDSKIIKGLNIRIWYKLLVFEIYSIIKNPTFITIMLIGLISLIADLWSFTGLYGTKNYPVTYDVLSSIRNSFSIFMISIIVFYSGTLVWKERDAKINEIQDASPIPTGYLYTSKLFGLISVIALVIGFTILIGICAQTLHGYTRYQLDVYLKSLMVMYALSLSYMTVIAILFQYIINNRYIAYFAFVVFYLLTIFLPSLLEFDSNMIIYGSTPNAIYSDMNQFGPFLPSLTWFHLYWGSFAILVAFISNSFYVRGNELTWVSRFKKAKNTLKNGMRYIVPVFLFFLFCAGYVFYNTQILNSYKSGDEIEQLQIRYEKELKKYKNLPQPRFTKIDYKIDLFPSERQMKVEIDAQIENKTNSPISEIHFNIPNELDPVNITIPGSTISFNDKDLSYRIYKLSSPMQPGDSLKFKIIGERIKNGFENEVTFTQLNRNGTFFNNMDICPTIGYSENYELSDKNDRKKYKLPTRTRLPVLNNDDIVNRNISYISNDADWVKISTLISTDPDQIAIAPGSLIKSYEKNGRKYFQYDLEKKSLNFYSFMSATYEVARKKFNGIDLEVYYFKEHKENVPNMLKSMEKSLEYYTKNFGKYYHKQCRIIEFPRYQSFAQAFPGTMPYSEGIGFIIDLRDVTKDDIDQVFYIVAHEMGHQYWAHQVIGAKMQGSEMMSESFAQYSSLMVMEKEYGRDLMKKFLSYEMDRYLKGRSNELEVERPIMRTENQAYIHYNKGSVLLYYLKEMIGENQVNKALRSLVDTFGYKGPPYPTSIHAVNAFRDVTPDSLQYLITDMFENITLFSNQVKEATYQKKGSAYEVTMKVICEKYKSDSIGKETLIPINDFIDVAVFTEPDKNSKNPKPVIYKRIRISKRENSFTFTVNELPYQVGIDPYCYLIDRIPSDNLKKVSES